MPWRGNADSSAPEPANRPASSASWPRRCSPDVVARRLGDEMVLVDLRTDRIYELNSTAARIWELIQAGEGGHGLVQRLTEEYAVDEDRASKEVSETIRWMTVERLLEPA